MKKPSILVVDDDRATRQLFERAFVKKGYNIYTAEDGNAALRKAKDKSFNLLIMDLKMPGISGIDLLKEIKKNSLYLEVIIVTGYPTVELAVEAIKIGAFDFISKPFDLEKISSAISSCLQKQKSDIKNQNKLIQAEKMATMGKLASGIAHEIRNPLSIILKGVELLELELSGEGGTAKEYIEKIKCNVERANNIIVELLNFSRTSKFKQQPLNVRELLDEVVDLTRNQANLNNVTISKDLPEKKIRIKGDYNMLRQAFFNLFINAIEAMPEGGKLWIRVCRKKESKAGEKKAIVIEVEDTGKGIPGDELSKIFDPFFTTKQPGKGTGLGLSIVQLIFERHKATIKAESRQDKGTKFIIRLPVSL
jgi:signal transduction histidine kinase